MPAWGDLAFCFVPKNPVSLTERPSYTHKYPALDAYSVAFSHAAQIMTLVVNLVNHYNE